MKGGPGKKNKGVYFRPFFFIFFREKIKKKGKINKGALDKVSRAYSSKFKHCSKEEICKKKGGLIVNINSLKQI